MFRRRFLQIIALASTGLAPLSAIEARASKTAIYRVKGFSCITCATGLDTMLLQQRGIRSSKSIYPDCKVTVVFDPDQIAEESHRNIHRWSGLYCRG